MNSMGEKREEIRKLVGEYYRQFLDVEREDYPISGKRFDEKELYSVVDTLLDGWWTEGRATKEFEECFSDHLGAKHAIVVNSGSSANLLALSALTSPKLGDRRLRHGDEVITVASCFPTTINPIIQTGCVPVFCDIELGTYNIDTSQLEDALSSKTKAVVLAHMLGNPFNIDEVKDLCDRHDLWLIEDCCDALGSTYDDKPVGTFGDLSTFSFYPAHHITMGEGGAVATDDSMLARIVRSMRDWGKDCWCGTGIDNRCGDRYEKKMGGLPRGYDHKYVYSELGYNLKNTDLNVAIGLAQLEKLGKFIAMRERNFKALDEGLRKYSNWFIFPKSAPKAKPSWFGYPLTIKAGAKLDRGDILRHLNQKGVGTRPLFSGNITKQPYFIENKVKHRVAKTLKNTDIVMEQSFWVGTNQLLNAAKMRKMAGIFAQYLDGI